MIREHLRELIELTDTFLDVFPECTPGDDATRAVEEYVERRTEIFSCLEDDGIPKRDAGLLEELHARDEKVRVMLVNEMSAVQTELQRLKTGRVALSGYKAQGVSAKRNLGFKG